MLRRNTWRPARLTNTDTISITSGLVVISVLYALDYGVIAQPNQGTLNIVEQVFPLWFWSTIITTGAVLLLVGIGQRIHALVWGSHYFLALIYFALTVGVTQGAIESGGAGIRGAGILGFVTLMHGLFALRMGPRSLSTGEITTTDAIYGGDSNQEK